MKKTLFGISLILGLSVLLTGCGTTTHRTGPLTGVFTETGLPRSMYLVGGGWDISYLTPTSGTIILAEANTGQILLTRSVGSNHLFEIDLLQTDSRQHEDFFGRPISQIRFNLYFVPARGEVRVADSGR